MSSLSIHELILINCHLLKEGKSILVPCGIRSRCFKESESKTKYNLVNVCVCVCVCVCWGGGVNDPIILAGSERDEQSSVSDLEAPADAIQ